MLAEVKNVAEKRLALESGIVGAEKLAIVVSRQEHRGVDNMLGVDAKVLLAKGDCGILADADGVKLLGGSCALERVFWRICPFGNAERGGIGDSFRISPTIGESEIGISDIMGMGRTVEVVWSPYLVTSDDETVVVALLDGIKVLRRLEVEIFLDEWVFRLDVQIIGKDYSSP